MLDKNYPLKSPGNGSSIKRALIAVGAVALVTIGVAFTIYLSIMRERILPTPVPSMATYTITAATTVQQPGQSLVQVVGQVKEYSPGALIAIIKPLSGNIEQVIIPDDVEVAYQDGRPSNLSRLIPGAVATFTGTVDQLQRLIAKTIIVAEATPTPRPTEPTTPSETPTLAPEQDTPTPEPTGIPVAVWLGAYYDNPELAGDPVFLRNDPVIDFQWGDLAPVAGIPADGFSVRWEGRWEFDEGGFRVNAYSDDGVRVWVDGVLLIDQWVEQPPTLATADVYLKAGIHDIKVEYFEASYGAEVRIWWDFRGRFPEWQGEYFTNPNLSGDPVLMRNDEVLLFDWGLSAPAPQVPVDHFSVRWTRTIVFEEGPFRFTVTVNDGVRLYVDGILLIDRWHESPQQTYYGYINLSGGPHTIKVEYFDHTDAALIKLGWDRQNVFTNWKGEYFGNLELSGAPALLRDDAEIKFDWGTQAPEANLPADNFTVRWSRAIAFEGGYYRFYANADDGVRIKVEDILLVDAWRASAGMVEGFINLSAGEHLVVVEFMEKTGNASIEFGWEKSALPSPTPTNTTAPVDTPAPTATPSLTPDPSVPTEEPSTRNQQVTHR